MAPHKIAPVMKHSAKGHKQQAEIQFGVYFALTLDGSG
jgi:hypothetical protein